MYNDHGGQDRSKNQLGGSRTPEAETGGEGTVPGGSHHLPHRLRLLRYFPRALSPPSCHRSSSSPLGRALREEAKSFEIVGEAGGCRS